MRTRLTRIAGKAAAGAGRVARSVPGVAALGCAVAGVQIKWGTGWALLAGVPFLLLMDRRL